MGIDGSGVTVAVLADGLDPNNPDFVRNAAYGQAGTPVITQYLDFSGDGTAGQHRWRGSIRRRELDRGPGQQGL